LVDVQPPIVPHVEHDGDSRNFEAYPEVDLNASPSGVNGYDATTTLSDPSMFDDF
jgi:hypothetical protein